MAFALARPACCNGLIMPHIPRDHHIAMQNRVIKYDLIVNACEAAIDSPDNANTKLLLRYV